MDQVLKNDTRREEFDKFVDACASDHAKGADSFPKLFARGVKEAANGVLSLDKDTDGLDDAAKITQRFARKDAKRVFADPKQAKAAAASAKVQASKMRTAIRLGTSAPTGVDPFALIEKAAELHTQQVTSGCQVKGAYSALVDVARAQLNSETPLTDEQIVAVITPKEGADKTVASIASECQRKLEKLITGQAGCPFDGDEELKGAIIEAHDTLRDALAAFTLKTERAAKMAELQALAAEQGVTLVMPEAEVAEAA